MEMAVLLARRQARTFSTGLICGVWGGSGMSVMLSGTRSALPSDTRFVPAPHLDFLAAHRIGQVGLYLGGKAFKRLPGLRVGFRAGAPKPERGKLPACRAFLHRHTQAPFGLALQTDTPPADNTVRFRTGACADERGLPRRVEEWVTPRRPASPSSL